MTVLAVPIPFVDPRARGTTLVLQEDAWVSTRGVRFSIRDGVADFTDVADEGQRQTASSFGYKWTRQPDWGFAPGQEAVVRAAWRDFFGFSDPEELAALMRAKVVLDAGCGAGTALNQFVDLPDAIAAVDISDAIYACRARFGDRPNVMFARADITELPFADAVFDVIWSSGVLHHTPDTFASLRAIVRHLKPGGRIVFYVYLKKAPIREFVDDYVRARIAPLPPPEAWRRMEALTKVGKRLSELHAEIVIDDDVPELGFKAGSYDLQRFIYYNVFKCFWNEALPFDHNVHVNFDWYHPAYSHRHTPDEVRGWLETLGLTAERFVVSESGIGVVAALGATETVR